MQEFFGVNRLVVIFIKRILNLISHKTQSLLSDTVVSCVFVFVLINIIWAYIFLITDWGVKRLEFFNVIGTWVGSAATFSAVVVSLYIAYGHHYRRLKIIPFIGKNKRIIIENFNSFPVAITFMVYSLNSDSKLAEELAEEVYGCFLSVDFKMPIYNIMDEEPGPLKLGPSEIFVIEASKEKAVLLYTNYCNCVASELNIDMSNMKFEIVIESLGHNEKFKLPFYFHDLM